MPIERLTKEFITDPQHWRLSVEITDKAIEMVCSEIGATSDSLIYRQIPIEIGVSDPISAISDVVYDNPLLLADFGRTDVLIDTSHFLTIPMEISDESTHKSIFEAFWPNEAHELLTCPIGCSTEMLAAGVSQRLSSFLRRTFPSAQVKHRLMPLLSYLTTSVHDPASAALYLNIHELSIDIAYFTPTGLEVLNTIAAPTFEDKLYYALNIAKTSTFDPENNKIVICAPLMSHTGGIVGIDISEVPESELLKAELENHVKQVAILAAPAEVAKLGPQALMAPLELTLLSLCE